MKSLPRLLLIPFRCRCYIFHIQTNKHEEKKNTQICMCAVCFRINCVGKNILYYFCCSTMRSCQTTCGCMQYLWLLQISISWACLLVSWRCYCYFYALDWYILVLINKFLCRKESVIQTLECFSLKYEGR